MGGKEKFKTLKGVFDEITLRTLFKLSSQGYFEDLKSPLFIGKEANVYSATTKEGNFVAIKIYRTSANFKKMYEYLVLDPRFSNLKRQKMGIIWTWAKKEYRNLIKARQAGVRVPKPIAVDKNVLVMEYIGNDEVSQRLSKDFPENPKVFFEKLIKDLSLLYRKAKLVHSDLSEFNILNHEGEPVIIDMSQAIDLRYPNVETFLLRDVKNLVRFSKKLKLNLTEEEILEQIKNG